MCIMNPGEQKKTIQLDRFAERIKDFTKGYDVATGTTIDLGKSLTIGEKSMLVLELKPPTP
jgi:hypothetical protein